MSPSESGLPMMTFAVDPYSYLGFIHSARYCLPVSSVAPGLTDVSLSPILPRLEEQKNMGKRVAARTVSGVSSKVIHNLSAASQTFAPNGLLAKVTDSVVDRFRPSLSSPPFNGSDEGQKSDAARAADGEVDDDRKTDLTRPSAKVRPVRAPRARAAETRQGQAGESSSVQRRAAKRADSKAVSTSGGLPSDQDEKIPVPTGRANDNVRSEQVSGETAFSTETARGRSGGRRAHAVDKPAPVTKTGTRRQDSCEDTATSVAAQPSASPASSQTSYVKSKPKESPQKAARISKSVFGGKRDRDGARAMEALPTAAETKETTNSSEATPRRTKTQARQDRLAKQNKPKSPENAPGDGGAGDDNSLGLFGRLIKGSNDKTLASAAGDDESSSKVPQIPAVKPGREARREARLEAKRRAVLESQTNNGNVSFPHSSSLYQGQVGGSNMAHPDRISPVEVVKHVSRAILGRSSRRKEQRGSSIETIDDSVAGTDTRRGETRRKKRGPGLFKQRMGELHPHTRGSSVIFTDDDGDGKVEANTKEGTRRKPWVGFGAPWSPRNPATSAAATTNSTGNPDHDESDRSTSETGGEGSDAEDKWRGSSAFVFGLGG